MQGRGISNKPTKKEKFPFFEDKEGNKIFIKVGESDVQELAKGGRAGYKMGSKCKLATKGKGRAYGKNS